MKNEGTGNNGAFLSTQHLIASGFAVYGEEAVFGVSAFDFTWVGNPEYKSLTGGEPFDMHDAYGKTQHSESINVYYVYSADGDRKAYLFWMSEWGDMSQAGGLYVYLSITDTVCSLRPVL